MDTRKLKELAESLGWDTKELYKELRAEAVTETDLSNFGRILKDLREIEKLNRIRYNLMLELLIEPTASYEAIGKRVGFGKSRKCRAIVHWHVKELSTSYPWIRELMARKATTYHHSRRNEVPA